MKCLEREAIGRDPKEMILVHSLNLIQWDTTSSKGPDELLMFLSGNCFNSQTPRLTEEGIFVSASKTRPKRCMKREVAIFACLAR